MGGGGRRATKRSEYGDSSEDLIVSRISIVLLLAFMLMFFGALAVSSPFGISGTFLTVLCGLACPLIVVGVCQSLLSRSGCSEAPQVSRRSTAEGPDEFDSQALPR